jgi:DNA-binding transcriptional ArsR family regulator
VGIVDDVREVAALTHPVRIAALAALRSPDSAAGVARAIGQSRQLVNYHLKELERAGLIVPSGERRKGNFVEQLYRRSRARSSCRLVSPGVAKIAIGRCETKSPRAARRARRATARDAGSSSTARSTANRSQRDRRRRADFPDEAAPARS